MISALVIFTTVVVAVSMVGVTIALLFGSHVENDATRFSGKTLLMLQLLRVMLPYLLLVCLAAVFMGMLNARGHFFIPAMGATMLNVVMIASVLFLAPRMGLHYPKEQRLPHQIFALAIGVLAAGVAQAAFQLPTLKRDGFRFHWVSPWRDETVQRVIRQMLPATIGVAAFQINVVLTQGLSYWVDDYVVASFQYAVRLMELPQGLFGISLATYLLPALSGLAADKNYEGFRTELRQGISYLVFTNLIASVLLVVLAEPIIRLLFERGKFDANSTHEAALALACLAPGLVAFSLVNILARAFYALGDTRTPMKVSVFCLVINLLIAVSLVWRFKQGGLGIANTLTSLVNVGLLAYALRRKLKTLNLSPLKQPFLLLALLTVLAGAIAFGLWSIWETRFGHANLALKLGAVFVPAGIAGGIYWLGAMACNIPAAKEMTEFAMAKFRRR
jgi:putative peptidoglycan lipid II flippase